VPPSGQRCVGSAKKRQMSAKKEFVLASHVEKSKGWLYFLDDQGNICRYPAKKTQGTREELKEIVLETEIVRDPNYLYYLDGSGNIYRSKRKVGNGKHNQLNELDELENNFKEGVRKLREHLSVERNKSAIIKKKQQVLSGTGKLSCEVCNFDFSLTYGKLGYSFCEVHHEKPISEYVRNTRLSDLAIVCSNCHRMLHRHGFRTMEELKQIVRDSQQS
jgi:5-methylcytosine-specific restriction endonuclease McrA